VAVLGIDQPVLVKEWQGRLDGALVTPAAAAAVPVVVPQA
jgi:hypothetical protein